MGTIAGSDVLVSSSWFLVAALIAVIMAPNVERVSPGLGPWKYVAGLAFAVILCLSVLLHEASHAMMARHYGFPVSSITLHFLGGMTAIEGEATKPRQEFMIAVVGPITSILVRRRLAQAVVRRPDGLLQMAVGSLAAMNLFVGVLNLVPGLPLDGGRVLKAIVWGTTETYRGTIVARLGAAAHSGGRARLAAGRGGRSGAQAALHRLRPRLRRRDLPVVRGDGGDLHARLRRRLPQLVARDLARRTLAVPDDLPLAEAVRRARRRRRAAS